MSKAKMEPLNDADYYKLLGISRSADEKEINKVRTAPRTGRGGPAC